MVSQREFATDVALRLQKAGFDAYWAGGCVRDQLLGRTPKDYDVATSATPEEIRELFGYRRTIAIGAAFGVITVLGPRQSDGPIQIEVATFRSDAEYSDGRHPDHVVFTDARHDAQRRDFTVNGMFFDPIKKEIVDFVGGQSDLQSGIVRAIGDPQLRINEDKLRMLRAVRFAATLDFELEAKTLNAVAENATDIKTVSAERIGAELQRMLAHPNRLKAWRLLEKTELAKHIMPDVSLLFPDTSSREPILESLRHLGESDFETAAAGLLIHVIADSGVAEIGWNWRLSNDQQRDIQWIATATPQIANAIQLDWYRVQPLLVHAQISRALQLAEARYRADPDANQRASLDFCHDRLAWPPDKLNPMPLLDGNDLKQMKIPAGPIYKSILEHVRNDQLMGKIASEEQAKDAARQIFRSLNRSADK